MYTLILVHVYVYNLSLCIDSCRLLVSQYLIHVTSPHHRVRMAPHVCRLATDSSSVHAQFPLLARTAKQVSITVYTVV